MSRGAKKIGPQRKTVDKMLQVAEWLALGYTRAKILGIVANEKTEWAIGPDMVDEIIHKVKEQWKSDLAAEMPYLREEAIESRKKLYDLCIEKGDYSTARGVKMDMDKITGAYTEKVEIDDNRRPPVLDAIKVVIVKDGTHEPG